MSSSNSNFDSSGEKQSINFPKPPSNWTKDASQHRSKNSDMNQPSQRHSQSIPFNNVQPIQPYNSQCYTNMPVLVDKKYAPNNHNNNGDTQVNCSRTYIASFLYFMCLLLLYFLRCALHARNELATFLQGKVRLSPYKR